MAPPRSRSPRPFLAPLAFVGLGALAAAAPQTRQTAPAPRRPSDPPAAPAAGPEVGLPIPGERLSREELGPCWVETMEVVLARQALEPPTTELRNRVRGERRGAWIVPSRRATRYASSGWRYVANEWGDPRMAIGFGGLVDVEGVYVLAHGEPGAWAGGLRAVGYREGVEVGCTEWFRDVDDTPGWFAIGLEGVDRIELLARPAVGGAGFYGLDDLAFVRRGEGAGRAGDERLHVVLDFEDLPWGTELSGSGYGGLAWETGTGDFRQGIGIVDAPAAPPGPAEGEQAQAPALPPVYGGGGTLPTLVSDFKGPQIFDAGAGWIPPDTCGSIGPAHFVAVVNQNMSVYDRTSGSRLVDVSLQSFFNTGGSAGDPRCVYDHFEDRWIVIATEFTNGVFFAYSLTSDPTGAWFKGFVTMNGGVDAGTWPDYPLLGVDENGIYTAAYMVGNNFEMSVFAIDKAPLLTGAPSLGTVSAWRQLPWEGAVQPAVTYGTPGSEYLICWASSTQLRLRRIDPPLSAPTMTELGLVNVPFFSSAPSAPALGSTVNLSTVDARLMNAVYRDGSVWAAHNVDESGRSACRWYEVDVATVATNQVGTVSDPSLHYFFPGISVNADGDAVLGCTASDASTWAGAYYTGRESTDPPGQMAAPVAFHAGEGPYDLATSGTNRWGDYSLTSVDPLDDHTLWTIQEYSLPGNVGWGTWIAELETMGGPGTPTCFGDGSGTICPCGNTGAPGEGCRNSTGVGAVLSAGGSANVAADDLVLHASQARPNKNGVFLQGAVPLGVPFRDGILCVGDPTERLEFTTLDAAGAVSSTVSIVTEGVVSAGQTRQYQFWFRDGMGPCATGSNLTNGLEVDWL